jgi:hemerythrin superfamily protein
MNSEIAERLRKLESSLVRLSSTEGEVIIARLLSISEEHQDVVLDIISTSQPERYDRLGRQYNDGAWAIPFEYIRDVQPER